MIKQAREGLKTRETPQRKIVVSLVNRGLSRRQGTASLNKRKYKSKTRKRINCSTTGHSLLGSDNGSRSNINSPAITTFNSKISKNFNVRPNDRLLKSRIAGHRQMSTSSDYSKIFTKEKLAKTHAWTNTTTNQPMSLSLSTKYGNLSSQNIHESMGNLRKSWSKPSQLNMSNENEYTSQPVFVQDSYNQNIFPNYRNMSRISDTRLQSRLLLNKSSILRGSEVESLRYRSPTNYITTKNALETDLSSFTIYENSITSERIEKLTTIEREDKKSKHQREILSLNCSEMLRSAHKQLK